MLKYKMLKYMLNVEIYMYIIYVKNNKSQELVFSKFIISYLVK